MGFGVDRRWAMAGIRAMDSLARVSSPRTIAPTAPMAHKAPFLRHLCPIAEMGQKWIRNGTDMDQKCGRNEAETIRNDEKWTEIVQKWSRNDQKWDRNGAEMIRNGAETYQKL